MACNYSQNRRTPEEKQRPRRPEPPGTLFSLACFLDSPVPRGRIIPDRVEINFPIEGYPPKEKGIKHPLCLEGERACPPEDIGGPWGYAEYVDAIADPGHERHEEFLEWNGAFDPAKFSMEQTTRAMRRGLPKGY